VSIFKKIEDNNTILIKQAFLGSIVKFVFRNPVKTVGATLTGMEVKDKVKANDNVVQNAKNRIAGDLSRTTQKV